MNDKLQQALNEFEDAYRSFENSFNEGKVAGHEAGERLREKMKDNGAISAGVTVRTVLPLMISVIGIGLLRTMASTAKLGQVWRHF